MSCICKLADQAAQFWQMVRELELGLKSWLGQEPHEIRCEYVLQWWFHTKHSRAVETIGTVSYWSFHVGDIFRFLVKWLFSLFICRETSSRDLYRYSHSNDKFAHFIRCESAGTMIACFMLLVVIKKVVDQHLWNFSIALSLLALFILKPLLCCKRSMKCSSLSWMPLPKMFIWPALRFTGR